MPSKTCKSQWDTVAVAAVVLLAFSFAFGGASREHALRLALVELAALPLLVVAAGQLIRTGAWRDHRLALGIVGGVVGLAFAQLIPLPPAVWSVLPGRDQLVLALELAGIEAGWVPLSLVPDKTWQSLLALLPPLAAFAAALALQERQRVVMMRLCVAAAVVGVLWGAAQLVSGGTQLYPWATTGAGSVTGFFANRNHLASFVLMVLPFPLIWGAAALRRSEQRTLPLWLGAMFAALIVVALASIRSRMGVILFPPVAVASLLAAWIASGKGRPSPRWLIALGVAGAALTAASIVAFSPVLARFDTQGASETRFERWPFVAETAQTYLPLGSGIGSFDPVYRSVEPLEELDGTFFNQAHNDYLEIWLETGWPGAILLIAFFAWYADRCWSAWRGSSSRERDLQRGASIAIGVLILHSVSDYPLRTATLAVVFALCCGLLELAQRPDRPSRRQPS